jgi:hypothetical protein
MTNVELRALCAELFDQLSAYEECNDGEEVSQHWNYTNCNELLHRARAALATPPPEPPTDEELDALEEKLWKEYKTIGYLGEEFMYDSSFGNALSDYRAVLERWGK